MFPLQGDNKKMEDAKFYLTLPGTKVEMEEKELQASKNTGSFAPAKDSTKDSFQIATLICSTKLTQNGRCGDLSDPQNEFSIGSSWAPLLNSEDWTICLLRWGPRLSGFCSLCDVLGRTIK